MKVWLVLFGILLELNHTLVRVLLQKIRRFKSHADMLAWWQPTFIISILMFTCHWSFTDEAGSEVNKAVWATLQLNWPDNFWVKTVKMQVTLMRCWKTQWFNVDNVDVSMTKQALQCERSLLPSWPSYCSLSHTCAAVSPSSWRGDEASARSSEMLVVCQPSCSCLVVKKKPVTESLMCNLSSGRNSEI